ncbi:MAG: (2Fe-2S) ferredoxin domain-containing protein [Bacteroidales bacterium]
MNKIKSLADLKRIRDEKGEEAENLVQVKVAMATCGIASGAKETMEFMTEALEKRGVDAIVTQVGCMGYCYAEPTIEVKLPGSDPVVFGGVNRKKADEIIEKYIKSGELVDGIIPVNYATIDSKK